MGAGGSVGTGHSLGSEPHSSAVWPWEDHLTSLSPGFLICKMGGWSREEDGGGRGSLGCERSAVSLWDQGDSDPGCGSRQGPSPPQDPSQAQPQPSKALLGSCAPPPGPALTPS